MRVIGYVRVSTEEQALDGQSLEVQRGKVEGYASLYDLELVGIIEDGGVSAKTLKRPGLERALKMLAKGEVDGIVIAKLDRLTRSVGDWQVLIDGYFGEKAGRQLFSVADSIDTTHASGRLVLNILLSCAQWERESIGERTKDALQHKIHKFERCGKVRFGFDLDTDGIHLIPNAQEQQTLTLIRQLRDAGETLRAIADELNGRAIPTKEGRPWAHGTVARILSRAA